MHYSVFSNGKILTPTGVVDGGVLVRDGVVAGVVTAREARELILRDDIEKFDLKRGCLIPGFVDAHFHLIALALKGLRCDLSGATSAATLVETLSQHARTVEDEAPVVGVEWDESAWSDQAVPTRDQLDGISRATPVYARRVCGHVGVANSALLGLLQVDSRFLDADTGLLTEDAVFEANRSCYPPAEAVADSVEPAIRILHSHGITGIHDIIDARNFGTYINGLMRSRVSLRVEGLFHVSPDEFPAIAERAAHVSEKGFRAAGIKIFADGSLGGRTAALDQPYSDNHNARGELLVDPNELAATVGTCVEMGIVCAVHAIGDRAIGAVVDAMSGSKGDLGQLRIEHAEILSETLIHRIAEEQVMLAMQPNFVRRWGGEGGLYEARLGRERLNWNNPFRALESAGVPFVFSSDGMPTGPLFGITGATRHPIEKQRLTPAIALRKYTSAVNAMDPYRCGSGNIEVGATADFAVLSGDPLVSDLDTVRVEATYISGNLVYERPRDS